MQLTTSRGYKTKDVSDNEVCISFTGAAGYVILSEGNFQLIYMSGISGSVFKITEEIHKELRKHFR